VAVLTAAGCVACGPRADTAGSSATTAVATTTTATPPTTTVAPTTTTVVATIPPSTTSTTVVPGPAVRISLGADRPAVALTFDAGSDAGFTAQILDELAAAGVHASFGVTGKWAEANPDLFRRIVAEGHHVVNHTYDHASMTGRSTQSPGLDALARAAEVEHADQVFVALAGRSSKPWFRPPYGDADLELDVEVGALGYAYDVFWSVDSLGWKGLPADEIVERCRAALRPGAIVLMHVGSQSQDAAALPAVIDAARAAGLTPGSLLDVVP
jgi:peptidoglycan/xylan/chitin deacetylase (PgdA/CDA1 family)